MLKTIEESYILAYIGVCFSILFATTWIWKFLKILRIHLFCLPKPDLKKCGQWAVITGGNSGIGRGYATELAKRGLDIVIVSNELEALKDAAEEIKSEYGVQCRYIHADLSEDNACGNVFKSLNNLDIGILINCAGVVGNSPCRFLEDSDRIVSLMIELHIKAVVNMTRLFLPSVLARNRGAIVNVSSASSIVPTPFISLYSACKAFSDRFTRALCYEYKSENVSFQSLTPFFIWTRMVQELMKNVKYAKLFKFGILDRDKFVRDAVKTINVTSYTTGNWVSDIALYQQDIIKYFVRKFFLKFVLKMKKM